MHYEPDLEALRVLALVAKESSMSAASAQLGVSQQAISLRIRNLEKICACDCWCVPHGAPD
jgi:Bacterial regulatory helix-turn-helix protein, lysR family.